MSSGKDYSLPDALPAYPAPLRRSTTFYGGGSRIPCSSCGNLASFFNFADCTRYKGGIMLCSNECRDAYRKTNGRLPLS